MDLALQIKSQYDRLSKANKKIADYILTAKEDILNLSAAEIGENSNTSPASVIRFAKLFGYKSLEDLKIHIAKNISELKENCKLDTIISADDTSEELMNKISQIVTTTIQTLQYQIDLKQLERAFTYLQQAQIVYLYGIGASGLAAYDLYHKLNRTNIRAMYNMDTHMSIEFSNYTTPKDVVVAFSYSGQTKEILLAVKQAKKNGTKVIVVTRNKPSQLSKLGDVILNVPDNEHLVRIGAVASKFSTMFISDLLFLGVIKKDFTSVEEGIIATAKLTKELKVKNDEG